MRSFFFSYIGGKSKDLKYIKSYIDLKNVNIIVEPFCGSCSFSTHISNDDIKYYFNDNDKRLIDFLSEVKEGKFPEIVEYFNENMKKYIKNGKPSQKWYDLTKRKDVDTNEYFLMMRLRARGGMLNLHSKNEKVETYEHLTKIFRNAEMNCGDYRAVLEKFKNDASAFVFLDPPYFDSFNKSYIAYNKKDKYVGDNTAMYIDIVNFLKEARCKVMMIINSNAMTKFLYGNYIKGTYQKRYDISGRITEHLIINNY